MPWEDVYERIHRIWIRCLNGTPSDVNVVPSALQPRERVDTGIQPRNWILWLHVHITYSAMACYAMMPSYITRQICSHIWLVVFLGDMMTICVQCTDIKPCYWLCNVAKVYNGYCGGAVVWCGLYSVVFFPHRSMSIYIYVSVHISTTLFISTH